MPYIDVNTLDEKPEEKQVKQVKPMRNSGELAFFKQKRFKVKMPSKKAQQVMSRIQHDETKAIIKQFDETDESVANTINDITFRALTFPVKEANRDGMYRDMKSNEFMNKYVNKKIKNSYLEYMNDNLKFCALYGCNVMKHY